MMMIRPAGLDEADTLDALTGRSVRSWGYEPEFLEWKPEAIAVTPAFLAQSTTYVREDDGVVVSY